MPTIPKPRRTAGLRLAPVAAIAAAMALAGCENDYVEVDVLGPSQPPEPAPKLAPAAAAVVRPVSHVERLEIGSTATGIALTAYGEAPASRWFGARLAPRNDGRPGPDGFLEFDFMAAPPELNGGEAPPPGTAAQRAIRADRLLAQDQIAGAAGARVFARNGVAAIRFAAPEEG